MYGWNSFKSAEANILDPSSNPSLNADIKENLLSWLYINLSTLTNALVSSTLASAAFIYLIAVGPLNLLVSNLVAVVNKNKWSA